MKSTKDNLRKRGFTEKQDIEKYQTLQVKQLYYLLSSTLAVERTCAIEVLRTKLNINNKVYVKTLLELLAVEKALYTRKSICNSLVLGGENAVKQMCGYLGRIGNNQHKVVPESVSKKKSYPLARDIIARILGRMDKQNYASLLEELDTNDMLKLPELLDAIGYMVFYNKDLATVESFKKIWELLCRFKNDELIVWKITTCCSAFPLNNSIELLNYIKNNYTNTTIIAETNRSLNLLGV